MDAWDKGLDREVRMELIRQERDDARRRWEKAEREAAARKREAEDLRRLSLEDVV